IRVLGDALEIGMYGVAEHCKRDRRLALEKHAAQRPLQRDNGVGQRGLRDAAAPGRPREIALLAERQEVADLAHLHVTPRPYRLCSPTMLPSTRASQCEVVHTAALFLAGPWMGKRRATAR